MTTNLSQNPEIQSIKDFDNYVQAFQDVFVEMQKYNMCRNEIYGYFRKTIILPNGEEMNVEPGFIIAFVFGVGMKKLVLFQQCDEEEKVLYELLLETTKDIEDAIYWLYKNTCLQSLIDYRRLTIPAQVIQF